MGRRYQAILTYLNKPFRCFDIADDYIEIVENSKWADAVILATPTETHYHYLRSLMLYGIPVLCEKPISKEVDEIVSICDTYPLANLTMMMQYKCLDYPNHEGDSLYNYYNTGKDGLLWDCMQIIALGRGKVTLLNKSPIWTCILNGKRIEFSKMDKAYIDYVEEWLAKPGQDMSYLKRIHMKVHQYAKQ